MSRHAKGRSGLDKLLLIQAMPGQAPALQVRLLAAAAEALRLPGCNHCQVHASRRSAQHWIMHLQWQDQAALRHSLEGVLQALLQHLLDNGVLRAVHVFGGTDTLPPADLLDDIEPPSRTCG